MAARNFMGIEAPFAASFFFRRQANQMNGSDRHVPVCVEAVRRVLNVNVNVNVDVDVEGVPVMPVIDVNGVLKMVGCGMVDDDSVVMVPTTVAEFRQVACPVVDGKVLAVVNGVDGVVQVFFGVVDEVFRDVESVMGEVSVFVSVAVNHEVRSIVGVGDVSVTPDAAVSFEVPEPKKNVVVPGSVVRVPVRSVGGVPVEVFVVVNEVVGVTVTGLVGGVVFPVLKPVGQRSPVRTPSVG